MASAETRSLEERYAALPWETLPWAGDVVDAVKSVVSDRSGSVVEVGDNALIKSARGEEPSNGGFEGLDRGWERIFENETNHVAEVVFVKPETGKYSALNVRYEDGTNPQNLVLETSDGIQFTQEDIATLGERDQDRETWVYVVESD